MRQRVTFTTKDLSTANLKIRNNDIGAYEYLPDGSIVLDGYTGLETGTGDYESYQYREQDVSSWYQRKSIVLDKLEALPGGPLFVDFASDPSTLPTEFIIEFVDEISRRRAVPTFWLSGDCRFWIDSHPRILYWPFWLFRSSYQPAPLKRTKRFSCLCRRPTSGRDKVMAALIDQALIDSSLDVYSIRWKYQNREDQATHPDGWPNDHSINHAAWSTYSALIIETSQTPWGIISEKTRKSLESESGSIYWNSETSYRVLEDFGFDLRYAQHAIDDFDVMINHVRRLQDLQDCQDWYHANVGYFRHNRQNLVSGAWQRIWLDYLMRNLG